MANLEPALDFEQIIPPQPFLFQSVLGVDEEVPNRDLVVLELFGLGNQIELLRYWYRSYSIIDGYHLRAMGSME